MKLGNIKKITLGVLFALNTSLVSAGVTVIKTHDPVDPNAKATFSQVGLSGEKAEEVKGFGKSMPFPIALDVIVPDSWDVTHNSGAETLLVNWTGGTSWPYVLKDLSSRNDISVSINWNKKSVDFFSHEANLQSLEEAKEEKELIDLFEKEQEQIRTALLLKQEQSIRNKLELEKKQSQEKLIAKLEAEESDKLYIEELKREKEELAEQKALAESQNEELQEIIESSDINQNDGDIVSGVLIEGDTVEIEVSSKTVDSESYKEEYEERYVLPIDPSFEFFVEGGHEQEFDYYTPATYIAKSGYTVKENLEEWTKSIGWDLKYKTRVHYTIEFEIRYEGTFRESANPFIKLYKDAPRPLDIEYYPKQKLVVVQDLNFNKD